MACSRARAGLNWGSQGQRRGRCRVRRRAERVRRPARAKNRRRRVLVVTICSPRPSRTVQRARRRWRRSGPRGHDSTRRRTSDMSRLLIQPGAVCGFGRTTRPSTSYPDNFGPSPTPSSVGCGAVAPFGLLPCPIRPVPHRVSPCNLRGAASPWDGDGCWAPALAAREAGREWTLFDETDAHRHDFERRMAGQGNPDPAPLLGNLPARHESTGRSRT